MWKTTLHYQSLYPGQSEVIYWVKHGNGATSLNWGVYNEEYGNILKTTYMALKGLIKKFMEKNGIEISRYPNQELKRRLKLLKYFEINLILDVGANTGQYASLMLDLHFEGNIVSFEPLSAAYQRLLIASKKYKNWRAENMAIGDMDGEIEINISENSYSSSILPMLPEHLMNAPASRYINKEKVAIHKLDTIAPGFVQPDSRVFLKIDTQGYEKNVLDGAGRFLTDVTGLQVEMSLIPLYSQGILFQEMISFLREKGFQLYSLELGFSSEKTGQLLQMDGVFFRDKK